MNLEIFYGIFQKPQETLIFLYKKLQNIIEKNRSRKERGTLQGSGDNR